MPKRRVVVPLVVTFSVILRLCTHSQGITKQPPMDVNDYNFTNDVNSTTNFKTEQNATDSPEIINRGLGTKASADGPVVSTVQTPMTQNIQASDGCTCNLTPDFCDIGCCCDVADCSVTDLSSVFNNCRQEKKAAVCIESWLMFRANVDPQLVTDTGSLFCVQSANDQSITAQTTPVASKAPVSIFSPQFSLVEISSTLSASVYKVDGVILTYYTVKSIVSTLRQPAPATASSSCVERNPAKFLRFGSLSCSRLVSSQSCRKDNGLSFRSYFTNFSLLRVPRPFDVNISKIMIPIIPLVNQPEPTERNGSCLNVVSKVEYMITYTSAGEITAAVLKVSVIEAQFGTQILQQHAVQFQLDTPSSPPHSQPLVGLEAGMPVIGWFGGLAGPLMIPGLSLGGECSPDLIDRAPILFTHNTITGCTFRSGLSDCASLRAQIYNILRGTVTPNTVAMTAGSQPPQSRIIVQQCPEPTPAEMCKTGCLVPVSLSVRFLWARRGLLALPQNHILGVRYVFNCQILKCPVLYPLPLTTEVIFSDATVYPEPHRAKPQPEWKFPFGFFTQGAEEQARV